MKRKQNLIKRQHLISQFVSQQMLANNSFFVVWKYCFTYINNISDIIFSESLLISVTEDKNHE